MRSLHSRSSFMVDSHHGIDTVLYTPDWPIRTCSFSSTREPPCSRTVLVLCKTRQQLEPWSRLDAIQCLTWTNQNPLGSGQQWPVSDSVSRYWPGTHICWHVGACVDGSLSISFTVLGKSSSRTSLTLLCWVVLSYMAQVNCSITLNAGDDVSSGTNAEDDAVVKWFRGLTRWLLFFTIELGCHIASSEGVEEGQRLTLGFTKFQAHRVNVVVSKVPPCTKCNPQVQVRILLDKTVENSYKDHNHVCINSSDHLWM